MDNRTKKIVALLKKSYPRVVTRLNFENLFQLLIATVLSAQTTDEQVNKITEKLFVWVKEPQDLACLQPEQLEPFLKGCGLYRNKSRYLIAAGQIIMDKYEGRVPSQFEDLISLPGVGRKTANVILSAGLGVPAMAVDTHVFRVSRRLGLAASRTAEGVERELTEKLPPEEWLNVHRRLIAHGRKVCKARNPKCGFCILKQCCPSADLEMDRKEWNNDPDKAVSPRTEISLPDKTTAV